MNESIAMRFSNLNEAFSRISHHHTYWKVNILIHEDKRFIFFKLALNCWIVCKTLCMFQQFISAFWMIKTNFVLPICALNFYDIFITTNKGNDWLFSKLKKCKSNYTFYVCIIKSFIPYLRVIFKLIDIHQTYQNITISIIFERK